jgi:hydrogenase nickel incorporation protein HypA/HybF
VHELSLCQAIVDTVTRHADGHEVQRVEVRIGHFRQVVPDSMLFSWALLTTETELSGCELVIDAVPAVIACGACGQRTPLEAPILLCGHCESTDVSLVSGEEFFIVAIDRTREVC